jgi:hypothetical protein
LYKDRDYGIEFYELPWRKQRTRQRVRLIVLTTRRWGKHTTRRRRGPAQEGPSMTRPPAVGQWRSVAQETVRWPPEPRTRGLEHGACLTRADATRRWTMEVRCTGNRPLAARAPHKRARAWRMPHKGKRHPPLDNGGSLHRKPSAGPEPTWRSLYKGNQKKTTLPNLAHHMTM